MPDLPHDRAALIAAAQAAEAVAELLRFASEGSANDRPFGDIEVVEKLAEALLHAGRIEVDHIASLPGCAEEAYAVSSLTNACANHIEDWVG